MGTPSRLPFRWAIKRFSIEDMEELYAGIRWLAKNMMLISWGGDTSSSYTGTTISITCIGGVKGKWSTVMVPKETDLICFSGDLGAAYMGTATLEREKAVLKG